uniref:Uncharacterized protein n=1 Tax=Anopheles merus TaxID=30066 RepID=A0A182UQ53_ANOME
MRRVFYLERDKKRDSTLDDSIIGLRYRGYTTPDGVAAATATATTVATAAATANGDNNNQSSSSSASVSSTSRHRAGAGKGSPVGGGSPTLNQYDRRSPDGKDNDETYLIETKGGGASSSPAGGGVGLVSNHHPPTATGNHHAGGGIGGGHHHLHHHGSVNIPASAAAANGGSGVGGGGGGVATVAAATSTTTAAEVYSTSNSENGKINVQVTVLVGTLADLKKHRSQNRSSVSPENGSLLSGTAPSLAGSIGNGGSTTPNGANGATPVELSLVSNELQQQQHHHHHLHHPQHASPHLNSRQQQQHYYGDGSVNGTGNGSLHGSVAVGESEAGTPGGTLSKFSGNTSDVVSDSTRSRRCCVVM